MPSTVVIGEGALALQCLSVLRARGLTPSLVCSFDDSLAEACAEHRIPHVSSRSAVMRWQAEHGCDDLLSIRNPWVLPAKLLATVRRRAINFHDSLLPRYAGLHATSWALIHGEQEHGISWHEITPGIDEGHLLAQVTVPIEAEDTALTLNTKCFEAAATAFEEVVVEALLTNGEALTPQQGTRSYFGVEDRPPVQGVLDLRQPAATLVNLVRALDFGHAPNPMGRAKLWLGDRVVLVRKARATLDASTAAPGTLVSCHSGELRVATGTRDLVLSDLTEFEGSVLDASQLETMLRDEVGRPLPALAPEEQEAISTLDRRMSRGERGWIRRLTGGTAPAGHPYVPTHAWGDARPAALPRLAEALAQVEPDARAARARAVIAALAARLHPEGRRDLGVLCSEPMGHARALFASVVPLRVPEAARASFEDFATAVQRAWSRVARHPTFPLDLGPRIPALRGRPVLPPRWPLAMFEGDAPPPDLGVEVAILLSVDPDLGLVRPWVTESITDEQVERIDAQLAALASAAQDDLLRPVAALPLVDAAERQRLLVAWNDTARPLPRACIHELFEQQALRTPEAPAVRFGRDRLDYAALDARANQLAHALRERGVEVDDRVGLAVGRSVELVVALLAILKAGATYVPVDHHLPRPRLEHMLGLCRPTLVVTDARSDDALAELGVERFPLHDRASALADRPRSAPGVPTDPERIAYVIFTSGSTGEPKAVEVYHRGVVNHALAVQEHYAFTTADRMLCSAPISFDIAAEQIYPPLLHGAEVVVRPDDLLESFLGFDAFLREHEITTVALPTAFWHEWVRTLSARDLPVPPSLRVLGVGTEKVLGEALATWRAQQTHPLRFIQGYGPTEATITCTMYVHDGDDVDPSRPLPIGRPLANTEIYLLDASGQPVPVGMPGELYVGGAGVAHGYLGRPELTAERFIPHPFSAEPGARLYRTGDIARYEADGQLVFLGRADAQVKIRGFRVELGEIEAVVAAEPGVRECVVVLRDDPGQARRLVAYLLVDPGHDGADLEARCRDRLPEYMVPSAFHVLDAFPVNVNGKIDRAALPAPTAPVRRRDRDANDDVELIVAGAFAEVLGLPEVGMSDGFFDLGGDSLGAMTLLEQLESLFEMTIPLEQFLRTSTVEALSSFICRGTRQGTVDRPSVVRLKGGDGTPVFLVLGMFLYQYLARAMEGDEPIYSVYLPLETDLLRRAEPLPPVEELARRYIELLRRHTPHGPYVLGGSSFGGVVAYEMARQLEADGEIVRLVVLLDTVLPGGRAHGLRPWAKVVTRALLTEQRTEVLSRIRARLQRLGATATAGETASTPDPKQAERDRLAVWRDEQYERAQRAYERTERPYAGDVVLYRARAPRRPVMPFHGFERHATGRIEACDVPGDHMSMLQTGQIESVARDLQRRLASPSETSCNDPAPKTTPSSSYCSRYDATTIGS